MSGDRAPDWTRRPEPDEYAPYYETYLARIPAGDLLATLEREEARLLATIRAVPPDRETHAYAPGKWTIRELVGHVIDAERVFALRALWFARGADTPLPGFEENRWARTSNAAERALSLLGEELVAVRRASVALLRGLDGPALDRRGVANGVEFTVRAAAWIIAGHALHHRIVLEERYVQKIAAPAGAP